MQQTAVVPDEHVALAPFVPVDEARLGREFQKLVPQLTSHLARPTDDVRSMRADDQRLADVGRNGPDQSLAGRRPHETSVGQEGGRPSTATWSTDPENKNTKTYS